MLDDGKPKAGAFFRPAVGNADAVKPLGQPRHMLRRDAGAVIDDRHLDRRTGGIAQMDIDDLALLAAFAGVLDEVLEDLDEIVALAGHFGRTLRPSKTDFPPQALVARPHRLAAVAEQPAPAPPPPRPDD